MQVSKSNVEKKGKNEFQWRFSEMLRRIWGTEGWEKSISHVPRSSARSIGRGVSLGMLNSWALAVLCYLLQSPARASCHRWQRIKGKACAISQAPLSLLFTSLGREHNFSLFVSKSRHVFVIIALGRAGDSSQCRWGNSLRSDKDVYPWSNARLPFLATNNTRRYRSSVNNMQNCKRIVPLGRFRKPWDLTC